MRIRYGLVLLLSLLLAGCDSVQETDFRYQLENSIYKISVESSYGSQLISSEDSIIMVVNWLKNVEPLDTRFVSYPSTEMILTLYFDANNTLKIQSSFPSEKMVANVIEYKGNVYSAGPAPDISEFNYFRKVFSDSNLQFE